MSGICHYLIATWYNPVGGVYSVDHAFLYSNGQMADLGTLGGSDNASEAFDINNRGVVVGMSYVVAGKFLFNQKAFLYRDGQMTDLNTLIDPALGITLAQATAINDQGQIVANSTTSSYPNSHAYLLTPIPEPSTLALFGVALLGLGAWARRHPRVFR